MIYKPSRSSGRPPKFLYHHLSFPQPTHYHLFPNTRSAPAPTQRTDTCAQESWPQGENNEHEQVIAARGRATTRRSARRGRFFGRPTSYSWREQIRYRISCVTNFAKYLFPARTGLMGKFISACSPNSTERSLRASIPTHAQHRHAHMSGIVVLLLWVSLSSALVVHKTVTLRSNPLDFEQFGFEAGGEITLSAITSPAQENVSLLICTDKQFDLVSSYSDPNESGFCTNSKTCEYTTNNKTDVHYRVQNKNRYRIFNTCDCTFCKY